MNFSFVSSSQTTIFYYFVGSVIANMEFIDKFSQVKDMLGVIEKQVELENEEYYLYILDGLALYAGSFGKHQYEIFSTKILSKC